MNHSFKTNHVALISEEAVMASLRNMKAAQWTSIAGVALEMIAQGATDARMNLWANRFAVRGGLSTERGRRFSKACAELSRAPAFVAVVDASPDFDTMVSRGAKCALRIYGTLSNFERNETLTEVAAKEAEKAKEKAQATLLAAQEAVARIEADAKAAQADAKGAESQEHAENVAGLEAMSKAKQAIADAMPEGKAVEVPDLDVIAELTAQRDAALAEVATMKTAMGDLQARYVEACREADSAKNQAAVEREALIVAQRQIQALQQELATLRPALTLTQAKPRKAKAGAL